MAAGSPEDWLRHARSDLAIARAYPLHGALIEALCFHAQQAAEKAIKAVLIANGVAPPRTHNIGTLLDRLPSEIVVPFDLHEVSGLTDFAVTARYPGELEPVAEDEYHDAVKLARLWSSGPRRSPEDDSRIGQGVGYTWRLKKIGMTSVAPSRDPTRTAPMDARPVHG